MVAGFDQEAEGAAGEAVLPVLVERDDLHRDVAQRGSCLSWLSTDQPSMSGRKTSREIAVGRYFFAQDERVGAPRGAPAP